ncbi:MAG: excinuclease ABC subunit UvrA [Planctomycetota bacterium]
MPKVQRHVTVRGAREHNLRNVDLEFPRDALVTFTGVSGSGKSSLAYNTIYQEGQRRFLESLSSYARQFLGRMEKPKVDVVDGLSPTVSIDQKSVGHSPRSTVGTLTEVADFLRLLWSRLGVPECPQCGATVEAWSVDRIVEALLTTHREKRVLVLAPVVRERKGEYRQELAGWRARGFVRARVDGSVRRLDEDIVLERYKYHSIELVIDRLRVDGAERSRLAEAIEGAVALGGGSVLILDADAESAPGETFSTARACPNGHGALPEFEPRLFSFNSPVGACARCDGLGEVHNFDPDLLVRDASASLRGLALHGFTEDGKLAYGRLDLDHIAQVAEAYDFDLDTPWKKLPPKARKVVLHGSGTKTFEFRWARQSRTIKSSGKLRVPFPGLIPHLESVYGPATARHLDRYRRAQACPECGGARLNAAARHVRFEGLTLPHTLAWPIAQALHWFSSLTLSGNRARIAEEILREIRFRLTFLDSVGLGYLTLDRRANTLSGGESQRIRLAAQVGAGLRGVLYVLDEPSIGLHPRDQGRLLQTLFALRDRGNTVCVVEHDEDTIRNSDFLVDVGPAAGVHGGTVVAAGPPAEVARGDSLTARYLRGDLSIEVPKTRRPAGPRGFVEVLGASHHNLKDVDLAIPLGCFVAVTGVSGSGKSTLVNLILKRALRRALHGADDVPGLHREIRGLALLDKIVEIDQAPIGRTPRSNPATYTAVWDHVRDLFASLPESRLREYKKGRFSFNVASGRCEACEGAGVRTLEMQFLAPVEVECEECDGRRFNAETLEIEFKGRNVAQLLDLTIDDALELLGAFPKIARALSTLQDVGLGYVKLGQPSTTLSGGEAQRVKLATELQRPSTGRTIYVLDEPTTGLHFDDVRRLLACLERLVDAGNTVLVIEHNLDVVKRADWIIDLGPEGGPGGGRIVATGTPEEVAADPASHTGIALRPLLHGRPAELKDGGRIEKVDAPTAIEVRGARKNNLRSVDVSIPLDRFTVVTGPSGSGKTSLAFDTLFTEGQRRFVESMSTYARRFLGRMDRAPVDKLDGLGPAIAIDQKAASRSPRSTVATATEIQDYLRLLWARIGRPHCPTHGQELAAWSPSSIAKDVAAHLGKSRGYVLAPIAIPAARKESAELLHDYLEELRKGWRETGVLRVLVDGKEHRLDDAIPLGADGKVHELFVVLDRLTFDDRARVVDAVAQAGEFAHGRVVVRSTEGTTRVYTTDRSCPECGHVTPKDPHPRWFSFNHHSGACPSCTGLGRMAACVPELLVQHQAKPLFAGAIAHKGAAFTFLLKRGGWYHSTAVAVAKAHGFDLAEPYRDLPAQAREILMRGTGDQRYQITFKSDRGETSRRWDMAVTWKGLARQIEEWYRGQDPQLTAERFGAVMREQECPECRGDRLGPAQRAVLVGGVSLPAFTRLSVDEASAKVDALRLRKAEGTIARDVLREVQSRLSFLSSVGLGYLTLDRSAATLSGGEAQRIRLATQLGNRLVGVLYVLDEPTIGLHPSDTERLLGTLLELRDLGNTVVAIEHDEHVMRRADHIVDMGPGAGHRGGRVVAAGTPEEVIRNGDSLTGAYLRGELRIEVPTQRRSARGALHLRDCSTHNLSGFDLDVPLGCLVAVTGMSGSGKSSLVMDTLVPRLASGEYTAQGAEDLLAVVVDQSPIGTTPASNPATYTGVFTPIRELFAQLPQSRVKGFGPGRFSFNVAEGRCPTCEGKGQIKVEMHFLADVWVTCETCRGRRYDAETLTVDLHGKTIADVLEMEVDEAFEFFRDHRQIARPLQLLQDVGLGYLRLGQAGNTMSGGEAQRIKLVAQLAKRPSTNTLYVLDEPTTGLHLDDVKKLVAVLQRLVERGDSVLVVEHHLDVVKCADHVIELGPGAGPKGGRLLFQGTPEEMVRDANSVTGRFVAPLLPAGSSPATATRSKTNRTTRTRESAS